MFSILSAIVLNMENNCNAHKIDNIISSRAEYESMLTIIASYGGIKQEDELSFVSIGAGKPRNSQIVPKWTG